MADVVGWIGAAFVIAAYIMVTSDKVEGESRLYQVLNLVGAIGVGINVFAQKAWPAFTIQAVWGGVALLALVRQRSVPGAEEVGPVCVRGD